MPLIPLAGVAFSLAEGATLGFATLASTFTTIAAVGAVVSTVGYATGNKDLSTAGMVLGGIGGIGSLASAVGAFGSTASQASVLGSAGDVTAGDFPGAVVGAGGSFDGTTSLVDGADASAAAAAYSNSGDVVGQAFQLGGGNADMGGAAGWSATGGPAPAAPNADNLAAVTGSAAPGDTSAVLPDTVNKGSQVFSNSTSSPSAGSQTPNPATDMLSVSDNQPNIGPNIASADAKAALDYSSSNATRVSDGFSFVNKATGNTLMFNAATDTWNLAPAAGGLFSNLGGISNGAGMLGMGVIQAAGSLLSSSLDSLKPAQVAAYQAQAKANNAAAALQETQNANMGQPIPVARSMAVTGTVAPPPKPGGLMNSTGAMV